MKKNIFFLFIMLFMTVCSVGVFAQSNKKKKAEKEKIVMPVYPGGEKELHNFILSEMRYPSEARANKEIGEVLVAFSVGMDGSISGVRVLKSVSKSLDEEAVRVVKKMGAWIPGKRNGVPVRAEMTIPLNFRIIYDHDKYVAEDDEFQKTLDIVF